MRYSRKIECHQIVWLVAAAAQLGGATPGGAAAQDPTAALDTIRAMSLDSLETGRAVTYFRRSDSARAALLHENLDAFARFSSDFAQSDLIIRSAVLSEQDWQRLSSMPYGFPHNIGPPANLILAPAAAATRRNADTLLTGRSAEMLYIGHEGGHLLTWSLMPAAMLDSLHVADDQMSPQLRARFARFDEIPGWYWEFAASYFGLAFVATQDGRDGAKVRTYMNGLSSGPTPRFHSLDECFAEMMQAQGPGNVPYVQTEAGSYNFGWCQGVVGRIAHSVWARGVSIVEDIRRMVAAEGPISTRAIIADLERRAPGLREELQALGVNYGQSAGSRPQP